MTFLVNAVPSSYSCVVFFSLSLRLSKSEEDKDELKATLSSLRKEGYKINRALKVRQQNERALAFTMRHFESTTI